eukprot:scaffold18296_cov124-Isochrysis_galbana.AAC.5
MHDSTRLCRREPLCARPRARAPRAGRVVWGLGLVDQGRIRSPKDADQPLQTFGRAARLELVPPSRAFAPLARGQLSRQHIARRLRIRMQPTQHRELARGIRMLRSLSRKRARQLVLRRAAGGHIARRVGEPRAFQLARDRPIFSREARILHASPPQPACDAGHVPPPAWPPVPEPRAQPPHRPQPPFALPVSARALAPEPAPLPSPPPPDAAPGEAAPPRPPAPTAPRAPAPPHRSAAPPPPAPSRAPPRWPGDSGAAGPPQPAAAPVTPPRADFRIVRPPPAPSRAPPRWPGETGAARPPQPAAGRALPS